MKSLPLISFLLLCVTSYAQTEYRTFTSRAHFSWCDIAHTPGDITVNEMTVCYHCFNGTLVGIDKKGEEKWKINTEKWNSKHLTELRAWPYYKSYDAFFQLRDGTYYVLKSKSGKIKKVGDRKDLFKD